MKQPGKQQNKGRAVAWGVLFAAFSGLATAQTGAVGGGGAVSPPVSLPYIPLSPSVDVGVFKEKGGDTALSAGVLFGDTLRGRCVQRAATPARRRRHRL